MVIHVYKLRTACYVYKLRTACFCWLVCCTTTTTGTTCIQTEDCLLRWLVCGTTTQHIPNSAEYTIRNINYMENNSCRKRWFWRKLFSLITTCNSRFCPVPSWHRHDKSWEQHTRTHAHTRAHTERRSLYDVRISQQKQRKCLCDSVP